MLSVRKTLTYARVVVECDQAARFRHSPWNIGS